MADTERDQSRTSPAGRGEQDMSARMMLLLGGIMTAGVAAVLGMTTLVGRSGDASVTVPARPAAAGRTDVASAGPAASRPVRQVAITPHVAVPPTHGLAVDTAKVRLRATRLVVAGVLHIPSSLPAGEVARSDPIAGTGLPVGGGVTLSVSTGVPAAAQVAVPYLRGLTLEQARDAAARLELRIVVTGGSGSVTVQTPPPGAVTPRGAEIAVVLHR